MFLFPTEQNVVQLYVVSAVVVVGRTRPRATLLSMITIRKSVHGFPLLSYMGMGLRYKPRFKKAIRKNALVNQPIWPVPRNVCLLICSIISVWGYLEVPDWVELSNNGATKFNSTGSGEPAFKISKYLYFLDFLCHNIVWFEIFSKKQEIFSIYSVSDCLCRLVLHFHET